MKNGAEATVKKMMKTRSLTENSASQNKHGLMGRPTGILSLPLEVFLNIFACFDDLHDAFPARTHWKEYYERWVDEDRRSTIQSARLV